VRTTGGNLSSGQINFLADRRSRHECNLRFRLASNYRELVRHLDLIHAINMCSVDSSSISARHLSTIAWA